MTTARESDYQSSGDERVPHEVVPTNPVVEEWNRQSIPSDDDESGNLLDRDYTGMFEGPEKTLEVVFRRTDGMEHQVMSGDLSGEISTAGPVKRVGLRRLAREDLDRICARARCTILSVVSNRYLDAYVLSESSLFVYPYMYVCRYPPVSQTLQSTLSHLLVASFDCVITKG